jgi:PTH2 family peptidyl-tRNA hydrolase
MSVKMVVVIRKDLSMRKGKMCAQAAHAAMKFLTEKNVSTQDDRIEVQLDSVERRWFEEGTAKIVVSCADERELGELMHKAKRAGVQVHSITDAGRTEFHGVPTVTCAAFGPAESDRLDPITGELTLL